MRAHPRRAAVVVGAAAAALLTAAAAAAAHPFGPPLTATVGVDGERATVRWSAAEDDWVTLGDHLGVFAAALERGDTRTGAEQLADAPQLRDYLLGHVAVTPLVPAGAAPCDGEVTDLTPALGTDGVELTFTCDAPLTRFELRIDALVDVHDAYRTAVRADGGLAPASTLLTATRPSATWTVGGEGSSSGLGAGALVAAVAAPVAGAVVLRRTRRTEADA